MSSLGLKSGGRGSPPPRFGAVSAVLAGGDAGRAAVGAGRSRSGRGGVRSSSGCAAVSLMASSRQSGAALSRFTRIRPAPSRERQTRRSAALSQNGRRSRR